eukprot:9497957-Pyramimonas_sp.AAC.1
MEQAQWQLDRAVAEAESLEEQLVEARQAAAQAYMSHEHCENVYKETVRGLAAKVVPEEKKPAVPRLSLEDMLSGKDIDFDDGGLFGIEQLEGVEVQDADRDELERRKGELQQL